MKGNLYFFALWLAVLNITPVRAQLNWGLSAGGSLASLYPHQSHGVAPLWEYNSETYSLLVTGLAGVTAEAPINRRWSLNASLCYDVSGAHAVYGFGNLDVSHTSTLNIRMGYLRLPIQAIYRFNPGHGVRFLAGGGVYAAVGVRGKEKGTMVSWEGYGGPDTAVIDKRLAFANKATGNEALFPSTVKPFDAGYTIMAGIEWSHFRVSPSFSQGFVNIFPGDTFKGKNKSFSLSLVYWIHGG